MRVRKLVGSCPPALPVRIKLRHSNPTKNRGASISVGVCVRLLLGSNSQRTYFNRPIYGAQILYKLVRARSFSFAPLFLSNFKKNLKRQIDVKSVKESWVEKRFLPNFFQKSYSVLKFSKSFFGVKNNRGKKCFSMPARYRCDLDTHPKKMGVVESNAKRRTPEVRKRTR